MKNEKMHFSFLNSVNSDREAIGDSAGIPALCQNRSPVDITPLKLTFDHC